MGYFDTLKNIKKQSFLPVYLLYGTESYLIQDIRQAITKHALTDSEADVNLSVYDLDEISIQEVLMDAETFPFLGERKVLICHNPSFFKAKADKTQVEHDLKALQAYLDNPADYSIIVFIASYEKIDERKKIVKQIKSAGGLVPCQSIKDYEVSQWIQSIAKELHIQVDSQAFDLFIQENGTNLMAIRSELEKLALYVGEDKHITREVAELLLSHNPQASALKLVDAIMNQDMRRAMFLFKDLMKQNEEPIALLALFASQFRLIYQSKLMKKKGYNQNQIAQSVKAHPFAVKMAMKRETGFTKQQLDDIMLHLSEADAAMKQGRMEKELAFEMLLYRIIHRNQATPS
ncbi:DNA polymerase III subunit delta [Pontibacillus halophilus JSM 076056 = DSM 19796]|uniref:DNA polymerase III subunit delta n=1 Tax=Pontibacillus halophilus JSM 076056 = DSM 19796 TaxID=1385510 RepID=A0A0A5GQR2_9BACI|nr:DNA polymerase III subunit delta [Pontibacillus halophilus]KGX93563.1 DNA polymerase III subunit delta [Pontibacillus halophilus JSM 076056 = DSM 19796]